MANFEVANLRPFLIVVEPFGPHARTMCEIHFRTTHGHFRGRASPNAAPSYLPQHRGGLPEYCKL